MGKWGKRDAHPFPKKNQKRLEKNENTLYPFRKGSPGAHELEKTAAVQICLLSGLEDSRNAAKYFTCNQQGTGKRGASDDTEI